MELTFKQRKIIEDHIYLVKPIAKKWAHRFHVDFYDVYQVGCLALIQASTTVEILNPLYVHYLTKAIRNKVFSHLSQLSKIQRTEANTPDYFPETKGEKDPEFENVEREELSSKLHVSLSKLCSSKERMIMEMLWGLKDGRLKSQSEVARFFGKSRAAISSIDRKVKKRIRRSIGRTKAFEDFR